MYKFAGYGIKVGEDMTNLFAKNKDAATEMARQHNLQKYDIIQLFYFEPQKYEPKTISESV